MFGLWQLNYLQVLNNIFSKIEYWYGNKSLFNNFITSSSILAFAFLIAITAFVNVVAQEGAITPEGSVNESISSSSRSNTEFSAVNDTMSGQNASEWATSNATLAFAQSEEGTNDQTMQETGQSANKTGEAIQGNASDVGSKITEGAKGIVGKIGEGLEGLTK